MSAVVQKIRLDPSSTTRLARVVSQLTENPQLTMSPALRSMKLTYAFRNDHFGARHFVKDHLPKIRFDNPNLDIRVQRLRKTAEETWRPEIGLEFADGKKVIVDMHEKWSTSILKELMDAAGGERWQLWKQEASATGQPLVPGEENEHRVQKRSSKSLPPYEAFQVEQLKKGQRTGAAAVLP